MLKLLIAVDGSPHALRAMEAAARLQSETNGLEAVLVHVRDVPLHVEQYPVMDATAVERALQQQQSALLDEALSQARRTGLKQVETRAEVGVAAKEIVRLAAELGSDMIVIGTHGRGALAGLLLGSVAQRVVHRAEVPVLLVK
ncbi:MAG: universal stress protein [Leptothrix sp. (in: Bacteria)]|nr:universal stress protein [Leptothrix sp. (in: b-proteobacteria)]